ncbi:hypothetical protein CMU19_07195 [Elizabethkingia anophelis]|nr:hypothetical protein [Elizabethkingia anophelis]
MDSLSNRIKSSFKEEKSMVQIFEELNKEIKMENNLENKAKFFAQHWGQKVFVGHILEEVNSSYIDPMYDTSILELKSINDISDEDAEELGGLLGWKHPQEYRKHFLENHTHGDSLEQFEVDFLRSKGYVLPWMGLSIDDLIKYGWVKLKKVDNETVV